MKILPGTFAITAAMVGGALYALNAISIPLNAAPAPKTTKKTQSSQPPEFEEVYLKRIAFWQKKILIDPYSTLSRQKLARAHRDLARATGDEEHYRIAEAHLRNALRIHRGDKSNLKLELADTIMAFHKFTDAWQLANSVLQDSPKKWWVYGVRGDAALGMGSYEQARKDFETYAQKEPGFSSYTRLAHIRHLYGDDANAYHLLQKAKEDLRSNSPEPAAWIELRIGIHFLKKMALAEAEAAFKRSLSLAPSYYLAQEHLAEVYEIRGDIQKAKPLLESAIKTSPDPALILRLAEIEKELGNSPQADTLEKQAMAELMKISQSEPAHARDLAEVLVSNEKDLELAYDLLKKDQALRPGDLRTHFLLAKTHRLQGNFQRAKAHIVEALRTGSRDNEYRNEAMLIDRLAGA